MWWKQAHALTHTHTHAERYALFALAPLLVLFELLASDATFRLPALRLICNIMRWQACQGVCRLKTKSYDYKTYAYVDKLKEMLTLGSTQTSVLSACVCVYICSCLCVCACVCVRESVYICIWGYASAYISERERVFVHACVGMCLVFVCVYINACVLHKFSSRKPLSHAMQRKNNPTYTRACMVSWNRLHLAFGK